MGKKGMAVDTINQNDIKILEAQKKLESVVDPEVVQLLANTAEEIKLLICEKHKHGNHTSQPKKAKPVKKQTKDFQENPLESVKDIKQMLDNPKNLNGAKQEVMDKIYNALAKVPADVKKNVEIVLGASLKTEIKK